jgi:RNA polymerase sigma-70 factor (ECF subfamily)
VWNNRESIDLNQSFRAYLFRIAQNLVIDYYRKAARDKSMQILMLQEDSWYQHIEEQLVAKENLTMLHKIIDKLPAQQRRAYILHKVENKSYKEISELMQIAPSTINKHIHFAHRFVKEQLVHSPFLLKTILVALLLGN